MIRKLMMAALLACPLLAKADDVMKKQSDGTYIVNTTTLAKGVEGYNGATPVEIHIRKNTIVKVVMLINDETPQYHARVKRTMLPQYEGMKLDKKKPLPEVDGVTGATFTSDAVRENVRRGIDYYWKHK